MEAFYPSQHTKIYLVFHKSLYCAYIFFNPMDLFPTNKCIDAMEMLKDLKPEISGRKRKMESKASSSRNPFFSKFHGTWNKSGPIQRAFRTISVAIYFEDSDSMRES